MLHTNPAPERAMLGFTEAVIAHFGFLEERGFRCVKVDPTLVRYESERVFVNVYHGRSSYELVVEIGHSAYKPPPMESVKHSEGYVGRPNSEDMFTVWDIARYAGAPNVSETTSLQASTADQVQSFVPKLAELVQRYGGPALEGDADFLEQVRRHRSEESRRLRRRDELRQARSYAVDAWRRSDYKEVVRLLEAFQSELTASEVKKLTYARERLTS
jgi:hypothetical protein